MHSEHVSMPNMCLQDKFKVKSQYTHGHYLFNTIILKF